MAENAFEDANERPAEWVRRTGRPVKPKDAATLILVRREGGGLLVLLGRRHGGHSFMPDKWVFPGGRVERSDFSAPFAADLRPDVAARLERTCSASRARALALAAVRETFEEAGLLLGRRAPPRPGAGPWRTFLSHGALPDLSALTFVARAVTPPASPKRFDARFFLADAAALISLEREPDCGELDEIAWFSLADALALDLPSVTRFVLNALPDRLERPDLPVPSLRFERGRQRLVHL